MSTEDDVARVMKVTEALAGPMKVWALADNDGAGVSVSVHATEQMAREFWIDCMRHYPPSPTLQTIIEGIEHGDWSAEYSGVVWELTEQIVNQ